jgi:hypothetical protein
MSWYSMGWIVRVAHAEYTIVSAMRDPRLSDDALGGRQGSDPSLDSLSSIAQLRLKQHRRRRPPLRALLWAGSKSAAACPRGLRTDGSRLA